MKKIYMVPAVHAMVIQTNALLAVSGVDFDNTGGGGVTPKGGDATGPGLSRFSDFDEDDEF